MPGFQVFPIAQHGLIYQPNREPFTKVLVFYKCADAWMGLEES